MCVITASGCASGLLRSIGHLYPKHNGETVIAWLWARTVISPNPAVNAPVPLAGSFVLSKKKGRECWAKPVIEGNTCALRGD